MAKPTIGFGVVLIVLGLVAYFGSEPKLPEAAETPAAEQAEAATPAEATRSLTAMIPAFFGAPLLLCGLLALKESTLKHAMHGAAMVGLLGALGGLANGIRGALKDEPNWRATGYSVAMGVVCAIFVAMCVKSFIAARKRREAATAGTPS